jgi:hypothetical protein
MKMKGFFDRRLGTVLGLALVMITLFSYEAHEHRVVLGRWSYAFTGVLAAGMLGWVLVLILVRRSSRTHGPKQDRPRVFFDLGMLSWGTAYLLNGLLFGGDAGRFVDLNLVGSMAPVAASLEWMALIALFLATVSFLWPRAQGTWKNTLLSAVAVGAVLLLAEGVMRARAILFPTTQNYPTYSTQLWHRRYVELNGLGYRDTDHALEGRPATRRILFVGDSHAFGVGIERVEERLGEQVARELASLTSQQWDVIHASKPDSHTLDEIEFLRDGLRFEPDAVVLVYVFNDMDYLLPVTARGVLSRPPRTILDRFHPARIAFKNSYLYQEIHVRTRNLSWSVADEDGPYADAALLVRHLADLTRFVTIARSSGAAVGIVPYQPGASRLEASYYDRFIQGAARVGLPIWEVETTFGNRSPTELTVNRLDPHPNPLANRLAAGAVAVRVIETLEESR